MILTLKSDPFEVRKALESVLTDKCVSGVSASSKATIEIVLAEVLNNIVEHAYNQRSDGVITVEMVPSHTGLAFAVTDNGVAMPADELPKGKNHVLTCPVQDLPEGGFGWRLIHLMTTGLRYARASDVNVLHFHVPCDETSVL
jgi:serine/threonine-protein kinase RsbW